MKKVLFNFLLVCVFCCVQLTASATEKSLREQYRDAYFTTIAAASCLGVYMPESSAEFSFMQDYGWQISPYTEGDDKVKAHFSIAHNTCVDCNKKIYMVTFRGTSSKKDWGINLATAHTRYGGTTLDEMESIAAKAPEEKKPAVHEGFNTYVNTVLRASVVDEQSSFKGVFKEIMQNPDSHLILTGHSLGGAAATLLGERLISLGMPKDKFLVITFGAPAVGNDEFAMEYGDKINLLRITNTADPIPGSLQTFFGGYKQFGEHVKYHVSPTISSQQHDIAMYLDYSVSEYYKVFDKAAEAGLVHYLPYHKSTDGVPLVALWITNAPGVAKRPYVPDIKRLITDEYKSILPSYVVMDSGLDKDAVYRFEDILRLSREVGADYVLLCGIDGEQGQAQEYWYIVLNQSLFKADGSLLGITTFAKKVSPASGNIQAAGENFLRAKEDLRKQLPFIMTEHRTMLCYF